MLLLRYGMFPCRFAHEAKSHSYCFDEDGIGFAKGALKGKYSNDKDYKNALKLAKKKEQREFNGAYASLADINLKYEPIDDAKEKEVLDKVLAVLDTEGYPKLKTDPKFLSYVNGDNSTGLAHKKKDNKPCLYFKDYQPLGMVCQDAYPTKLKGGRKLMLLLDKMFAFSTTGFEAGCLIKSEDAYGMDKLLGETYDKMKSDQDAHEKADKRLTDVEKRVANLEEAHKDLAEAHNKLVAVVDKIKEDNNHTKEKLVEQGKAQEEQSKKLQKARAATAALDSKISKEFKLMNARYDASMASVNALTSERAYLKVQMDQDKKPWADKQEHIEKKFEKLQTDQNRKFEELQNDQKVLAKDLERHKEDLARHKELAATLKAFVKEKVKDQATHNAMIKKLGQHILSKNRDAEGVLYFCFTGIKSLNKEMEAMKAQHDRRSERTKEILTNVNHILKDHATRIKEVFASLKVVEDNVRGKADRSNVFYLTNRMEAISKMQNMSIEYYSDELARLAELETDVLNIQKKQGREDPIKLSQAADKALSCWQAKCKVAEEERKRKSDAVGGAYTLFTGEALKGGNDNDNEDASKDDDNEEVNEEDNEANPDPHKKEEATDPVEPPAPKKEEGPPDEGKDDTAPIVPPPTQEEEVTKKANAMGIEDDDNGNGYQPFDQDDATEEEAKKEEVKASTHTAKEEAKEEEVQVKAKARTAIPPERYMLILLVIVLGLSWVYQALVKSQSEDASSEL